jgi:acetyl-CoA carboxylase carboxyltransferase component
MTQKNFTYTVDSAIAKAQSGDEISDEELRGTVMHAQVSGLMDVLENSEKEGG